MKKRAKLHRINEWDCRPISKRIIDPNKARKFTERLQTIHQQKLDATDTALLKATTVSELKKAFQTKSTPKRHGTSGYLQLLDNEPPPLQSREEKLRNERLFRATEKKQQFLEQLYIKQLHVEKDHNYASKAFSTLSNTNLEVPVLENQHLVNELYNNHVYITGASIIDLELQTRAQSNLERWNFERTLRFTSSIMKEVCHKRDSTSAFIMKKLSQKSIDVSATRYGRQHEKSAIASYVNHHRACGVTVSVQPCGLPVDESSPWLAASPDGIVLDPTQSGDNQNGCLEVKCPILCQKSLISDVCRKSSSFCLKEENGEIRLSTTHAYYYQIQTEMHVTRLQWCDFVVWSPIEDTFVQRVYYNKPFMENIIAKVQAFYFEKYLPSIIPYMIVTPSDSGLITVKPVPTIPPTVKPTSNVPPTVKPAPTVLPIVKPASTIPSTVMSTSTIPPTVKPAPTISPTVKLTPTVPPTVKPTPTIPPIFKPAPTVPPTVKSTSTVPPTVKPAPTISPMVKPTPTVPPTVKPTPTFPPTVKLASTVLPIVKPAPTIPPTVKTVPPTVKTVPPTVKPTPAVPPTVKPASTVLPIVKSAPTIPPTVKPVSTIHPTVKPTPTAGLSIQSVSAQSGNLLPLTAV